MKTLKFTDGAEMPILGLGTWKSAPGEVYQAVKEALKVGYRHIDCAPIYGNEKEVGRALTEAFDEGIVRREEVWITSKLWNNAHAPKAVQPALEQTLKDLQLDYLDLFLIHWPVAQKEESVLPESPSDFLSLEDRPIQKTWEAMENLVDLKLVRHIGVSNFSIPKLEQLLQAARIKPAMNQIELHPYLQQPQMLDFCKKNNIFLTGYSPLGSSDRPEGLKAENEPVLLQDEKVAQIAAQKEASPAQVLISWAIHRGTAVIPKSVNPARIQQNLEAANVVLTPQDMAALESLDKARRYVDGTLWTMDGSPYTLTSLWEE